MGEGTRAHKVAQFELSGVTQGSCLVIERMREEHLERVVTIEKGSFSLPWSRFSFARELRETDFSVPIVASMAGEVVGYAVAWLVGGEMHLGNVAVSPEHRRTGIGSRLVQHLLAEADAKRCQAVVLEVRESNGAAIGLYEKLGFQPIALRKSYYRKPTEDAIVMLKNL